MYIAAKAPLLTARKHVTESRDAAKRHRFLLPRVWKLASSIYSIRTFGEDRTYGTVKPPVLWKI